MADDRRTQLYNELQTRETDDLLAIWQSAELGAWDEQALAIVKKLLLERLGYVPEQSLYIQADQLLRDAAEYGRTGQLEQALDACTRAIQLVPDWAPAYNLRGEAYDGLGQVENAFQDYRTAVRLDPNLEDAWENLLCAEQDLEEKFQASPARQHLDQAIAYLEQEQPEQAMQACELAKAVLPEIALAHTELGRVLEALEQFEPAEACYLAVIQLNPRYSAARGRLRNIRLRLEDEQFRLAALADPERDTAIEPEYGSGFDQAYDDDEEEEEDEEIAEAGDPLPAWVYLDEKAHYLTGWAGHRTRPGRSGYDPLELDFELAHIQGVMIGLLMRGKFRTRQPIYLLGMAAVGVICCLPLLAILVDAIAAPPMASILPQWVVWAIAFLLTTSPYCLVGIALLANVALSVRAALANEPDETGAAFF